MARFQIISGPQSGLLYEAAERREEFFKIYFTLVMEPLELPELSFKARPFRVYVCVDDPEYTYVNYSRVLKLRPFLGQEEALAHHLKLKGPYSLLNRTGQLETDGRYNNCLPLEWLGLSGRVINPLKRMHLSVVDDVTRRFSDWDLCQLYANETLELALPMTNEVAADAVRRVVVLRQRLESLELSLMGWRQTEAQLYASF